MELEEYSNVIFRVQIYAYYRLHTLFPTIFLKKMSFQTIFR